MCDKVIVTIQITTNYSVLPYNEIVDGKLKLYHVYAVTFHLFQYMCVEF